MKSLRAFKRIKNMYKYFVKKSRDLEPKLMICEKEDFNLVEKELKVLNIIKEKNVNVGLLKGLINGNPKTALEDYNDISGEEDLIKEEYDLLREVLL